MVSHLVDPVLAVGGRDAITILVGSPAITLVALAAQAYELDGSIRREDSMKPRFECDVCGANHETVQCNGKGCNMHVCSDCLKKHETYCVERLGDRTDCDAVPRFQNLEIRHVGLG